MMLDNLNLQPPIPARFRVHTLVQPQWRPSDLAKALNGERVLSALSEEIKRQYGVKYCLLLDRARTGLFLLSKGMNLRGEWLLTSFMHRPTAVLLHNIVSSIALADIKNDFTMSPESAENTLGRSTEVLLITHMYGKSADIRAFRSLADSKGLFLVENAVHVPGGMAVDAKPLGSWGDAAVLSFNVDKPLGGILGGALLTNRDDVWRAVTSQILSPGNSRETWDRILTTYVAYRLKPLIMRLPGFKKYGAPKDGVAEVEAFALDTYKHYTPRSIHILQAAIALGAVRRSPGYMQARIANAMLLNERLGGSDEIIPPRSTPSQPHSFLYFPIIFPQKSRFEAAVRYAEFGIETKWRYYPLHMQKDFASCRNAGLQNTERCWRSHLLLPIGPSLTREEVLYIAECTRILSGEK